MSRRHCPCLLAAAASLQVRRNTLCYLQYTTPPQSQTYRGYRYGRVVYTHGPGIDAPLSLIRMDYSDSISTPQLVVLHNDWRGEYDIGSYAGAWWRPDNRGW